MERGNRNQDGKTHGHIGPSAKRNAMAALDQPKPRR